MQTEIIETMRTQVRAIHRALTGDELPELEHEPEGTRDSDEDVVRRFLELEAITRSLPAVAERVPPFSFNPRLDVIAGEAEVILELALPGVAREDIVIEQVPGGLVVSGIRRDEHAAEGRTFHAEIPRGPFRREIPLPFTVEHEPRIELDRGVLRIHLASGATDRVTPACSSTDRSSTTGETGQ